jgi:hypothetical protein
MADINPLDIGPYFKAEVITPYVSTTAGGGDGSEVTPTNDIDASIYESGFVVISYLTSLNTSETLGFGLQIESSTTDGGGKGADTVIQAVTTVETGALTSHEDSTIIEVTADQLHAQSRYVNFLVTPSMSRSGTDTCVWSATWVGLLKNAPRS